PVGHSIARRRRLDGGLRFGRGARQPRIAVQAYRATGAFPANKWISRCRRRSFGRGAADRLLRQGRGSGRLQKLPGADIRRIEEQRLLEQASRPFVISADAEPHSGLNELPRAVRGHESGGLIFWSQPLKRLTVRVSWS